MSKFLMAAVVGAASLFTACSSGETDATADTDSFCDLARAYDDATGNVDVSDPEAFLVSIRTAASAARKMADAAPNGVKDEARALASAADDLAERLDGVDAQTMDELLAAAQTASSELEAKYGTLETETVSVIDEVEKACGFTPTS